MGGLGQNLSTSRAPRAEASPAAPVLMSELVIRADFPSARSRSRARSRTGNFRADPVQLTDPTYGPDVGDGEAEGVRIFFKIDYFDKA